MSMDVYVVGDWRSVALRGVAAFAFGALTLIWPDLTLTVLVYLFGAYALVDGVFTLAAVVTQSPETRGRRGILVLQGLLGVAAGIVTFAWPGITALALLYVIAAWAIIGGVLEIVAAIQLRAVLRNEWLLVLGGVASVVFGVLLVITPGAGALVITWLIGWYAVFLGVVLLALAWRLHRVQSSLRDNAAPFRPAATT
jgi:uncharacterized membrane protein HdeD (DUF308 family)